MGIGDFFSSAAGGAAGGSIFGVPGAVAGGLISGAASLIGGTAQNAANKQMQSQQFVDNAELQVQAQQYNTESATTAFQRSQQQMGQQEAYNTQMANTAYQRSVADEKAAGLNPILGIAQGGAGTPGLNITSPAAPTSGASSVSQATMQNVLSPAITNALQGFKLAGDVQAQQLSNQNTQKQGAVIDQTAENLKHQTGLIDSQAAAAQAAVAASAASANASNATAAQINQAVSKRDTFGTGIPGNLNETTGAIVKETAGAIKGLFNAVTGGSGGGDGVTQNASPNYMTIHPAPQ